jgi:ligand-binding sensor domain-containing protein
MKTVDTLWPSRVTKAVYHNGWYYIGTTNGLFRKNINGTIDTLSNLHPALSRRISGIAILDNQIWISSSDKGLVALEDKKVIAALSKSNGLSSDICRSIYASGNHVWVGTSSGLNKVIYANGKIAISKFGTYDGLPSDIINAIWERDSLVFIGTSEGLTYFNEKKLTTNSTCKLHILGVRPAKEYELLNGKYYLPYKHNSIGVEYTAISFRSAGDIRYYYRLKGLNDNWQVTRNQNLEFPALPPGEYTLELQAINRFGIRSDMLPLTFVVAAPFWRTWWFITLAALTVAVVTAFLLNRRNKKQNQRLEQKMEVEKKLAELEQQALQAQMNPHFIFNCLNSIQQYFLTNDGEKANKFLSMFAALVRETLHFSSQKSIRVSDEVRYLSRYLEMERMRFGDHFVYAINVASDLPANFVEIPALLLQPYVENAIRHGVRHRKGGSGIINISFVLEGDELHCIVADNGIGRDRSMSMKGRQPVEYQSRGMELGQKRIEALNKVSQRIIKIEIIDIKDDQGVALGTEVHLKIPV